MHEEQEKYRTLLQQAQTGQHPVVLINACTHGHETVGVHVIEALRTIPLLQGTLLFNIANERARKENTAFIESDLNRAFPGNPEGTYEERLASYIHPVVKACDIVIDIHATETAEPGVDSALIVTTFNEETKRIIALIAPPRVLYMEYTKHNALMSDAKVGVAFEYGENEHPETLARIVHDIRNLLANLAMMPKEEGGVGWDNDTTYYCVYDVYKKEEGMIIDSHIQNFAQVRKGDKVGEKHGVPVYAEQDFIPILFGEVRYKDIFGFCAEEMEV